MMGRVVAILGLLAGCHAARWECKRVALYDVPVSLLVGTADGKVVAVAGGPSPAVAVVDGRVLSIDRRIPLARRRAQGRVSDGALEDGGGRLWLVTDDGDVLSVDLHGPPNERRWVTVKEGLVAAAWDGQLRQLVVADAGGSIYALAPADGVLREITRIDLHIARLRAFEGWLYFACHEPGAGVGESVVGCIDMAKGTVAFEWRAESCSIVDLAVTRDRLWGVDTLGARLLEFDRRGHLIATRVLADDPTGNLTSNQAAGKASQELPRLPVPAYVDAVDRCVAVAGSDESGTRVLRYWRGEAGFPTLPSDQHVVEGACGGVLALASGHVAIAVEGEVVFVLRDRPERAAAE